MTVVIANQKWPRSLHWGTSVIHDPCRLRGLRYSIECAKSEMQQNRHSLSMTTNAAMRANTRMTIQPQKGAIQIETAPEQMSRTRRVCIQARPARRNPVHG